MTREAIISSCNYKITRKAVDYSQKYAKDDEVQKIVIDTFEDAAKFGYNLAIEKVCEWLEKNPLISIDNVNINIEFFKKPIKEDLNKNTESQSQPKFKLRDWIVDDFGNYWRVVKVRPNYYEIEGDDGVGSIPTRKWVDEKYHLWTIDDAKKGDILVVDGIWIVEFDKKMTDGCAWKDASILTSFVYDMDDDICILASHLCYKEIWPASKEDIDLFKEKRNEYLASNSHNESKFKVGDKV